jgi:hypothetical protein
MSMLFFWVVAPCGPVGRYHVSKEHTASLFGITLLILQNPTIRGVESYFAVYLCFTDNPKRC